MKKLLIIPARRHIAESYYEYLARYLGDEWLIDIAYPTIDNASPLAKNPDDYDLLLPMFDSHWFLPEDKYKHKVINVQFESGTRYQTISACTSDPVCKKMTGHEFHLRFPVDTELFNHFPQPREDDKLHVGFLGNIQTPRRYLRELFMPLAEVDGVKIDIYPTTWVNPRPDELELMGGEKVVENIEGGDKWLSGLPNIYNRMDVYVRCDIDHGYQFSVMEAAACGIPVVCTDSGPTKEVTDAGGGICVGDPQGDWSEKNLAVYAYKIKEAVIKFRDDPEARLVAGINGRSFVRFEYSPEKLIPEWRRFLNYAYEKVQNL